MKRDDLVDQLEMIISEMVDVRKASEDCLDAAKEELLRNPTMSEIDRYGMVITSDYKTIIPPTARLVAERVMGMCVQNRRAQLDKEKS